MSDIVTNKAELLSLLDLTSIAELEDWLDDSCDFLDFVNHLRVDDEAVEASLEWAGSGGAGYLTFPLSFSYPFDLGALLTEVERFDHYVGGAIAACGLAEEGATIGALGAEEDQTSELGEDVLWRVSPEDVAAVLGGGWRRTEIAGVAGSNGERIYAWFIPEDGRRVVLGVSAESLFVVPLEYDEQGEVRLEEWIDPTVDLWWTRVETGDGFDDWERYGAESLEQFRVALAPYARARRPVLLTGYDAKRCQRRVHNDHDQTLEPAPWEPSADLQKLFDSGRDFEAEVFADLEEQLPAARWRDLSDVRGKQALIDATVRAMDDDVELILGGWLPDDEEGGRTGRPDLLLRDGAGYVPGDVKWHKTVHARRSGTLRYSRAAEPARVLETGGLAALTTQRTDDHLQLAHYWRMLQACDRAADGGARGFIIGTDRLAELDPSGLTLTWLDLDTPLFTTFSRSRGTARRTALERYDFEQGIRLDIARVAEQRTGAADDPEPLVKPIFSHECASCPWHDYCHALAGDAASAHIVAGRLDVREWRALDRLGVTTLDDLAGLDLEDADFLSSYLPEVTHRGAQALERLSTAARRALMVRAGVAVERSIEGPVPVPRADIEIDFDIEDAEGFVYLWGALVTDGDAEPVFDPTITWDVLDTDSERALAQEFVDWLRAVRDRATAQGRTVLAYHYTAYELTALDRILGSEAIADVRDLFVDLYRIVADHYFGAAGLGLKKVAPAFGFQWRDDEPSGLLSQLWYADAVAAEDPEKSVAAKERLLAYNEDDVRATLAIREGMATR